MNYSFRTLKLSALSLLGLGIVLGSQVPAIAQTGNEASAPSQQAQMPEAAPSPSAQSPSAPSPAAPSIVDIAANSGSFDTLVAALKAADLVEALSGEGPLTVFAPPDAAFAALPSGVLEALLMPENKDLLTRVLTYHVVAGSAPANSLASGPVETLGGDVTVAVSPEQITVNGAKVLQADIQGSNGIIHVIDQVLVPEAVATELGDRMAAAAPATPATGSTVANPSSTGMADGMVNDMAEPESAAPVRGLW